MNADSRQGATEPRTAADEVAATDAAILDIVNTEGPGALDFHRRFAAMVGLFVEEVKSWTPERRAACMRRIRRMFPKTGTLLQETSDAVYMANLVCAAGFSSTSIRTTSEWLLEYSEEFHAACGERARKRAGVKS